MKYLATACSDLNAAAQDGSTPPYAAAESGHLEIVQYLATDDADVNAAHKDGYTPLYVASRNDHPEMVK